MKMSSNRARKKFKRYIRELIHNFRFTYEDISANTGIAVERIKAINKKEDPTQEESMTLGRFALALTKKRGEDSGEQGD
jgi:hypothetical protein